MATSEERLNILKMIQENKISAEEGMRLLELLEHPPSSPPSEPAPSSSNSRQARWLRVQVTDTDTGKVRVNIRMPVNVIMTGMKMGARFSPEIQGLHSEQLIDLIRSGATGKVIDIFDDEDGEHVEVTLE